MINRTIPPHIKNPVEFDVTLPPCEVYTLSNGVEVYAVNMGTEDTMMVNWAFFAGNWYEKNKLVAAATNYLLKNGTATRSALDINEHFEFYGSTLSRSAQSEIADITLHTLSRHLDKLLPMVAELFTDAIFPDEELSIFSQNGQQRLKIGLKKSDFVASRLIDAYLFGETHPYGKYSNLEDYAALQRDELRAFYDKYYHNGRCVIFVAGKLPSNIFDLLDRYFGTLPLKNHREDDGDVKHLLGPTLPQKRFITNDPDGVQAAIRIGRRFPNRHHPDFQKMLVLNNVFGGFFGSRLMTNIREDKGYTYGIYSYLLNQLQESGWLISTEAGRDVGPATVNEVYSEMELMRDEPIDEEELLMTRNYMIGSILGDLDGPFQVVGRWKSLVLNDLDENYFNNGIQIIKTITSEELRELANRYMQPEEFCELIVV